MLSTEELLAQKPRLLIIINRFVIGGQSADTVSLAWHLKKDFDILILYGEKEKDETEPLFLLQTYPGIALKKITYLKRSINPFADVFAFFQIYSIIIKNKFHIVHTHGSKPGFLGRLAAFVAGVPVIIHTFHGHFFHSYFSKYISGLIAFTEKIIGKITSGAIALSTSQKYEMVNQYKIFPAHKVAVIPLGFSFDDDNNSAASRKNFRSKYNLQDSDIAIGIIGRIVPVKNHSFFVKIIQKVLSTNTSNSPVFFIIGDGDLRLSIEEELRQKKISFSNKIISSQVRVVFTSWLTDISEVMSGLDIVALTSRNEGTPLSIIEAQFFKKSVVATDAGGVKDSMQNDITGFLIKQNDLDDFCQKLYKLIDSKKLREDMGEAGSRFVSVSFAKQKEIDAIKSLYTSLLNKKGYFK